MQSSPKTITHHPLVPYSDSDDSDEDKKCVGKRGNKKDSPVKLTESTKKKVLPNPCLNKNCRNECSSLSETSREHLNEHYWGMSPAKRRTCLLSYLRPKKIARRRAIPKEEGVNRRNNSFHYSVVYNRVTYKVCQKFILATLNISQMVLRNVLAKENSDQPKRKVVPHNKTNKHKMELLKDFFENLPAVPSQYSKTKSTKVYLPQEFKNIENLYRRYTQYMKDENLSHSIVSNSVFRRTLKQDFNIGFHLPTKIKGR